MEAQCKGPRPVPRRSAIRMTPALCCRKDYFVGSSLKPLTCVNPGEGVWMVDTAVAMETGTLPEVTVRILLCGHRI